MTQSAHGEGFMVVEEPAATRRKGFIRKGDIPATLLEDLNHGRAETATLAEWLAIDLPTLLEATLPGIGWSDGLATLAPVMNRLAGTDPSRRLKSLGAALYRALKRHPRRAAILEGLANHPSDMVRAWAAYVLRADRSVAFAARVTATRRFAADPSGAVRECAWEVLRPYVSVNVARALPALAAWVEDEDENLRRCAVETTRPLGAAGKPIQALRRDPQPGLLLLEPVRSDPSRYVQRAVAGWLDDASQSRPDWVVGVCDRWMRDSPTAETTRIVKQALRTVRACCGSLT